MLNILLLIPVQQFNNLILLPSAVESGGHIDWPPFLPQPRTSNNFLSHMLLHWVQYKR